MRVVIIGGGKVGAYLAKELRSARHPVIVIEKSRSRAEQIADETDALIVAGDGTDIRLLSQVEIRSTDFVLALTGIDQDNLVACQLARTSFSVSKLLARLNDPRNRTTFSALDIPVVSVTDLLVQVISRELDLKELVRVALLGRGEVSLFEVEIPAGFPTRPLQSIELPAQSVLVAIRRGGDILVPHGDTELHPGDRVMAVTLVSLEDEVRDRLLGKGNAKGDQTTEGPLKIVTNAAHDPEE